MQRKVVVTGLGLVTPLGNSVKASWDGIIKGKSGLTNIFSFDSKDLPCKIAAEVPRYPNENGFNADLFLDPQDQKRTGKFIHYAVAAAEEAILDSGWKVQTDEDSYTTGVAVGSGIGGLPNIEDASLLVSEKGHRRLSPFFIPSALINLAPGHISIKHQFKGPNHSAVTACASGANSIGDAYEMILRGVADVMVAGGTEGSICNIGIAGFCAVKALCTSYNENPTAGSRPWDKDRCGFVMGEGSGILILEELNHALARGAKIYAEIIGYGMSSDAGHITAPDPEGNGGYRCMKMAIERAGIQPEMVNYINAHATSTPAGDKAEFAAVKELFKNNINNLSMSSTKGHIGHMLGAAGAVEAIFTILAIQNNILPPTLNLDNIDDGFSEIDLVPKKAKAKEIEYGLSNSFGFGGVNCSLLFKKYQ